MPVILANPSRRRGKKSRKRNPKKRSRRASARRANPKRRRSRKNPGRRHARRSSRRRNPSSGWGGAVVDVLLGFLGGGVGVLAAKGAEMIPIAPVWQIAILVGAGLLGAIGVAKWGSVAAAAGLGGAVAGLGIARGVEIYALSKATAAARAELPAGGTESAALFDARAREAGAVRAGPGPVGVSMAHNPMMSTQRTIVPEAGYSRTFQVPQGTKFMGSRSWVNLTGREAGAVVRVVSAHNSR